jgi:hypothetical protein
VPVGTDTRFRIARTPARLVPWLLAEIALIFLEAMLWPAGGVWLLMLWNIALAAYRAVVAAAPTRRRKLGADGVFAILCLAAAWEGGWYLLPAVVAFGVVDAVTRPAPPLEPREIPGEQAAAAAAAVLGWLAIGFFVSGPLYSSATATLLSDGSIVSTQGPASAAEVGLSTQSVAVLGVTALLFGLTWLLASLDGRRRSAATYAGLAVTTLALCAVALLGSMSVGPLLAPGVAFAMVALWLAHSARSSATAAGQGTPG